MTGSGEASIGGLNDFGRFETAVRQTLEHPERGKQFFELRGLED